MAKFKNKFRIESSRLCGWDYSNAAWYFVTICSQKRGDVFGCISNNNICLNSIGNTAAEFWQNIPKHSDFVELDAFIVMPDHIHGIIIIDVENEKSKDFDKNLETSKFKVHSDKLYSNISPEKNSLSVIIRSYKSAVKLWCNRNEYFDFTWQPRFYDRIIRNEKELYNIQKYLSLNPLHQELDQQFFKP